MHFAIPPHQIDDEERRMPGSKAPQQERREQIMQAAYAVAAERGLERLTIRQVAASAGLSSGLVLFHFETREDLVIELLEWLLETTATLAVEPALAGLPPLERLCTVAGREIHRFSEDPARIRLLFEYWVLGMRHEAIQRRMRRDLHRYRDAFVPLVREVVAADPDRFPGVTAEGLAAVVVSFIKGCGIQTVIDLDHSDSHELRDAADGLLERLARAGAGA
jgi:AcrR family transcriptional regulator